MLTGGACLVTQNTVFARKGISVIYAYISAGKMAKRIKTPDLHLSQRNLKKIQPL